MEKEYQSPNTRDFSSKLIAYKKRLVTSMGERRTEAKLREYTRKKHARLHSYYRDVVRTQHWAPSGCLFKLDFEKPTFPKGTEVITTHLLCVHVPVT